MQPNPRLESFILSNPISIRELPGARGVEWFRESWVLFKRAPVALMLLPLIYFAGVFVCNLMPIVGYLLQFFFGIVMAYGGIYAVAVLDKTGEFRWSSFVEIARSRFLCMLGFSILKLLLVVFGLTISLVIIVLLAYGSFGTAFSIWSEMFSKSGMPGWDIFAPFLTIPVIGASLILGGFVFGLLVMIQYMGDALISLSDSDPIMAAMLSLKGVMKNAWPLTVAGLIGFGLLVPVALTLGLGFLIYYPILILVTYRAFIDIYVPNALAGSDKQLQTQNQI